MKTIWKFELETTDVQEIEMPFGSDILSIQNQNDKPCVWAMLDPEQTKEKRTFEIFGTGHPINFDLNLTRNYIGTYQLGNGEVYHVFESIVTT